MKFICAVLALALLSVSVNSWVTIYDDYTPKYSADLREEVFNMPVRVKSALERITGKAGPVVYVDRVEVLMQTSIRATLSRVWLAEEFADTFCALQDVYIAGSDWVPDTRSIGMLVQIDYDRELSRGLLMSMCDLLEADSGKQNLVSKQMRDTQDR